jgi:hypothetical protein
LILNSSAPHSPAIKPANKSDSTRIYFVEISSFVFAVRLSFKNYPPFQAENDGKQETFQKLNYSVKFRRKTTECGQSGIFCTEATESGRIKGFGTVGMVTMAGLTGISAGIGRNTAVAASFRQFSVLVFQLYGRPVTTGLPEH